MYAADISVTYSAEDLAERCHDLKTEVDNIAEWLKQNKLSLNTDKTEYMVVGHKRQTNNISEPIEIKINEEPIRRVQKVKYLGTMVDENLTWYEQYKRLKGKILLSHLYRN